jgi:hypothetical protein
MGNYKLVYNKVDFKKASFLFHHAESYADRFEVMDWFDSGIVVRYVVYLTRIPPNLIYVYVVILSFKEGKFYEKRKEFVLRRIKDDLFYRILNRLTKIKSTDEFMEFYRDLIYRMLY